MFDREDIMRRLMNGDSAEDIAKEMTKVLNDANRAYEDEKARANSEKTKIADMQAIIEYFAAWMEDYYDYDYEDIVASVTPEQIIELVDSVQNLSVLLTTKVAPTVKKVKNETKSALNDVKSNATDVINKLFSDMGW